MKKNLFYPLVLVLLTSLSFGQNSVWQKITPSQLDRATRLSSLNKDHYETYQLNLEGFKSQLTGVVERGTAAASSNQTIVSFPNESGNLEQFKVFEAPLLSPELALQFPNIKTYVGFSIENPGTRVRFSITPQGVQSMVTSVDKANTFLVPLNRNGNNQYIAYNKQSRANLVKEFECSTPNEVIKNDGTTTNANRDANDQLLRRLRIAISTTGEYTNFWNDGNAGNGNAQADALAQVVSTLNRTNEIFEVDMAITFQLVSGINIIYPTAASDPYTGTYNAQLQATLTSVVGEANYDIGHLFVYAGNNGNAGCIGCVCVNNQKGSGFSAHTFLDNDGGPYMSDFFDIDYVPHEIGHQMGANHTFATGNEGAGVNSEPGSGTTIMGYAGITGGNDVQNHSDAYWHYHSIRQILNNMVVRTCWTSTPITNNPPVANAGPDFIIPIGTAFILKGSATDPNVNDILTYCWEQIDSGVTTNTTFGPNNTAGPVWRSRPPVTTPNRYMPQFSRVLAGQLTQTNPTITVDNSSWETVSNVARTLNFALTVRDRSEANGTGQSPQTSYDTMLVTVNGTAGPFTVTSQNTNVLWNVGTSQTITWNVAGTDIAPVNTPNVNILLSTNGGLTFPFTLATNVPNDGSQTITVPVIGGDSTQARIIVEGNGNIFYAVNSTNFSIQGSEFVLNAPVTTATVCAGSNAVYNFTYNTFLGFTGTTTFSATGLPGGATIAFSPATAVTDGTAVTATVSNTGSLAPGTYNFNLVGTSGAIVKTVGVTLTVYNNTLVAANLATPADGATNVGAAVNFTWNADTNAQNYLVEVATDNGFATIVSSGTVTTNSYSATLATNTTFYWRVRASNTCLTAPYSTVFSFTTANISCGTFVATNTPVAISAVGATGVYNSIINVPSNLVITDVNVNVNITHTWDSDLNISLISPAGTIIDLSSGNGGQGDNYTNTIFDQQATTLVTAGAAPFTGSFIPEGNLSLLNGELSGGNWTIRVADTANLDGGTINSLSITLCAQGTLLSVNQNEFSAFSIFPNPNNGTFTIKMNSESSETINVTVFDSRGRSILQKAYAPTNSFEEIIQLDNVQAGIYLVNVSDGINQTTKKIIVK
jgi:subtilisin-like proprotein convertase family protein